MTRRLLSGLPRRRAAPEPPSAWPYVALSEIIRAAGADAEPMHVLVSFRRPSGRSVMYDLSRGDSIPVAEEAGGYLDAPELAETLDGPQR